MSHECMEFIKNKTNMDARMLILNCQGKKKAIAGLKKSVISLKIVILSNPGMGSDGLRKKVFQFTYTLSKMFKPGKE